jgi:hypothetical protein
MGRSSDGSKKAAAAAGGTAAEGRDSIGADIRHARDNIIILLENTVVLRYRQTFLDPNSFYPVSWIPNPGSSSKNLSILTQNKIFLSTRIPDPDPELLSIPNPDPQH